MNWTRSLFAKLALGLVVVFVAAGVGAYLLLNRAARWHALEVQQALSHDVAAAIVKHNELFTPEGEVNEEGLGGVFMKLMAVNPTLECYLLDVDGEILGYDAPEEKILVDRVDLEPVRTFLAGAPGLVLGDDPRASGRPNIFSAARIESGGELRGYVYAILASEQWAHQAAAQRADRFVRDGGLVVAGFTVVGAGAALLLLWMLTRHLRALRDRMNAFRAGDDGARAEVRGSDEVAALAHDFNFLADTVVAQVRRIRRSDRMRREMLSNISHDLRTPVASLRGYLETVLDKEGLPPERRREYLEAAMRNTGRLSRLIDDLFELARLEAGEIKPQMEPFPVAELVSDVVQKFRPAAEERGIRLEAVLPEGATEVRGDIGLLERVLDNLVDNALRYTPRDGRVRVAVREARDGRGVEVRVADTGCGIPKDVLPRIFDRFYRVDAARGERSGGTGLGLAIVKRILALHDSVIGVASKPQKGTTFAFHLPA